MSNIVTIKTHGAEPPRWNRCEWEFTGPGRKEIRYETDVDLEIVLRNLAIAGGLAAMRDGGAPIAMLLWCPECSSRHVDEGEFATKPHHTHACQSCGHVWRPAIVATCGVQFLPGFKNEVTR